MAVIYSKLGGCLGLTAKLGPSARTDLCDCVKGLLDRLMTHLGLGSSGEDPWGSLLGLWGVRLLSQVPTLSAWEAVLFPWEAWRALNLAEHLPDLVPWLPDWPAWEELSPARGRWTPAWEAGEAAGLPPSLGDRMLLACLPPGKPDCLPLNCYLPQEEGASLPGWAKLLASLEGSWAPAWEVTTWLPAWDTILPSPRGRRAPACCLR